MTVRRRADVRCDDARVGPTGPTVPPPDRAGGTPGAAPEGEPDYRMSLAADAAGHLAVRRVLGALLVLLGMFVAVEARRRFRSVDHAIRRGQALPRTPLVTVVALGVVAAAALALILVLLL